MNKLNAQETEFMNLAYHQALLSLALCVSALSKP